MKDLDLFQTEEEPEEQAGISDPGPDAGPGGALPPDPEGGEDPGAQEALEAMKALAGNAVEVLRSLMEDPDTSPTVRVKVCEMILDRTYGKTSSTVKTASTAQTVQESLAYILSLVEQVRGEQNE